MQQTLVAHAGLARRLVALFEARFDPARASAEAERELLREIESGLEQVPSLDDDRILRRVLETMCATTRTNAFQRARDGALKPYISLKFDPRKVPELPEPRPMYEIFVYAPRVEGVHLRGGSVARGGLRWSDRREDFRTEVLGLMKAQMVKNAVIVPVGSKGGFVVKQPPPGGRARGAAEGRHRVLPDLPARPARPDRQPGRRQAGAAAGRGAPRRRRRLPGGGRRQGHRELLRHRQRRGRRVRLLARRRLRLGRLGRLRPQEDGHHRARRLGVGQAPLPRAGHRHPVAALHRGRHRRHVGRRVRQRHAAVAPHQAGRRLRSPPHLHRSRAGRRGELPRARAPVRAAALVLGRLRREADLEGRRRVAAQRQVDRALARGAPRARHRGGARSRRTSW